MAKQSNKISDLIADNKNFNKGSEFGNSLIEKSFRKFGAGRSILIDKNNRIIAGNKSVENAMAIGMEDVQIVESDGTKIIAVKRTDIDLDSEQGREMALADNASAKANIVFDAEIIEAELGEAVCVEWGIELVKEEPEAEEDDFDVPEGGIETDIVLGDLFEIGEHRLLCGDSTDSDAVARLMDGQKAELLFTSPPYSDMRDYNGEKDLSVTNLIEFIPTFLPYANYQLINLGLQRKNGEVVQYWDDYIQIAKDCGLKLLSWNIWNRESATSIGMQTAFFPIFHEWLFLFGTETKEINRTNPKSEASYERQKYSKPGTRRQKDGTLKKSDKGNTSYDLVKMGTVITLKAANTIGESTHPAMFPIDLPAEYIKAMTNEGDYVCEPFTGSGTTMVASHQLKRKCYGMELDPKYCQVIIDRMQKLDPTLKIKRNGQPYEVTIKA
jgi:DNA modification methylase